jgi:hypothetical protein
VYIPKADGRQRPLGVAALEDKIVQQAVVGILNQIYEEDFRGFSYGFRPGRSQHQALDASATGILGTRRSARHRWRGNSHCHDVDGPGSPSRMGSKLMATVSLKTASSAFVCCRWLAAT